VIDKAMLACKNSGNDSKAARWPAKDP